jgi:hypothetical protein
MTNNIKTLASMLPQTDTFSHCVGDFHPDLRVREFSTMEVSCDMASHAWGVNPHYLDKVSESLENLEAYALQGPLDIDPRDFF